MFTRAEALHRAAVARQQAAHWQAVELECLAIYAQGSAEEQGFAPLEVAALLHLSGKAAQDRLQLAVDLTRRLPLTLAALKAGRIDDYKARVIADAITYLTPEHAAAVEARVLERAVEQTVPQLRRSLARAVIAVDPAAAEQRRQAKVADRRVYCQPLQDGQAELVIEDSVDKIVAMYGVITSRARHLKALGGESRTLAQIEADVACELLLGSDCERRVVEVHVTLPASGPAEIDGIGPITRDHALELAGEARRWRWIKTDPATGRVLDLTTASYSPPKVLAELVKVRDRTCRHPGCLRPARRCDIDHVVRWPDGATCDANCACLCRRHHRAKHEGGWRLEHDPQSGICVWKSPLGFTHVVKPEPVTDPDPPP